MASRTFGLPLTILTRLFKAPACSRSLIHGRHYSQTNSKTSVSNDNTELISKQYLSPSCGAHQLLSFQSKSYLYGLSSLAVCCSPIHPFIQLEQRRFYQAALKPRLICPGCYFVWRHGRKHVECSDHPRHKQMKRVATRKMWKEDYTTGNWIKALDFNKVNYRRAERNIDRTSMSHNWAAGKLGNEF